MSGKKTEAVETLPADIRHSTFDIRQSSALPHNRYHRAARSSAAMAIVYAAMAGRELIECRKKIKHGGWLKWVEQNCDFSVDTAERYLGLYSGLKEKLSNSAHVRNLMESADRARIENLVALLDRPPSELLPEETETLLADLREATKGETLRQLYFDFGLVSLPKSTGGAAHLHSFLKAAYPDHPEYIGPALEDLPKEVIAAWKKHLEDEERNKLPPGETMAHFNAVEFWNGIAVSIHQDLKQFRRYSHLHLFELKQVSMDLLDAKNAIDDLIKKG